MCVITIIYDSILQGQRCRTKPILQNFSLWIEIRERRSLLYVRHHGRIAYPETAINATATTSVCQHGEEGVFVDVILAFAEALRAVLIGGTETVVRLAAQTNESVPAPLNLEQSRRPLVEGLARDATRLGGCPRESDETSLDVFCLVIITAFSREPFGSVTEVVLPMLVSHEGVDAVAGQRDVRRVRVHFTVLVEGPLDVSTILSPR